MVNFVEVKITTADILSMLPPYPIVLVTTRTNIITVNQVAYFTFSPLRMGIAIAHNHHSYGLLMEEQAFVINVPGVNLVEAVKRCGTLSGRDGDKFARVGLTCLAADTVDAARIAECGAFIECQVNQMLKFEHRTWFIGKVVAASMKPGHTGKTALMCGRQDYHVTGEVIAPR